MSLRSFINYISFEKRFSPHTIKAYEADVKQVLDYLYETFEISQLDEIEHTHLRSWLVYLVEGKKEPRSINRKLSSVRAFFKFLQRSGKVSSNPATRLRALKLPKRLPVYLQEKETSKLPQFDTTADSYGCLRNTMILQALYVTGMRRSELIDLRVEDVDLDNQTYRITGKGGKMRLVPFATPHQESLITYLEVRAKSNKLHLPWLFLTDKGKQLYPKFVYNLVRSHLSMISTVMQRGPHILRHTFATHMSNHGADLNAIKNLLGHANLSATQIYTHNSIEKLKNVYQKAHPKATDQ